MKRAALVLLVIGCLQIAGDLLGLRALKAVGAATMIAPAPRVFSAVQGLETYSTSFEIVWTDTNGQERSLALTPEVCARIEGPYNRRNVYGAALAYGPVLAADPRGRRMLAAVLQFALCGDAPLLRELGVDPSTVVPPLEVRYTPLFGTDMGDLPRVIEAPLR